MFKCFLDIYCESCIKDTVTNKTCKISVLVEHTLFWLKSSFGFFCKMVQKKPEQTFYDNILVKEVPKKGKRKKPNQIFQTEANAIKRRNRILWWGGCKTDAARGGQEVFLRRWQLNATKEPVRVTLWTEYEQNAQKVSGLMMNLYCEY